MKLTAKKAVELSIELWTWLEETGEEKDEWPKWERNGGEYPKVEFLCFLCEYADYKPHRNKLSCKLCPYFIKYKARCFWMSSPFYKWEEAIEWGEGDSKKYAKRFLGQLKKLLQETE
jgi:hypothetical protein